MQFACQITKARKKDTHSKCVLFHRNSGYMNAPQRYVILTLPVSFFIFYWSVYISRLKMFRFKVEEFLQSEMMWCMFLVIEHVRFPF